MELIILNISILGLLGLAVSIYLFVHKPLKELVVKQQESIKRTNVLEKEVKQLIQSNDMLKKRIDDIFVVEPPAKPSPNDVTQVNEDLNEFSESRPMDLPKDIKIEIEGGDTLIPPSYYGTK